MIDVIGIANLTFAIIATSLLSFVLAFDVSGRMRPFRILFLRSPLAAVGNQFSSVSQSPSAGFLSYAFLLAMVSSSTIFEDSFLILFIVGVLALAILHLIDLTPLPIAFGPFFLMSLTETALKLCRLLRILGAPLHSIIMPLLFGRRTGDLLSGSNTLFVRHAIGAVYLSRTRLAIALEELLANLYLIEMFKRGWFIFAAAGAAFGRLCGRMRVHRNLPFCARPRGAREASPGLRFGLYPHYTTGEANA